MFCALRIVNTENCSLSSVLKRNKLNSDSQTAATSQNLFAFHDEVLGRALRMTCWAVPCIPIAPQASVADFSTVGPYIDLVVLNLNTPNDKFSTSGHYP